MNTQFLFQIRALVDGLRSLSNVLLERLGFLTRRTRDHWNETAMQHVEQTVLDFSMDGLRIAVGRQSEDVSPTVKWVRRLLESQEGRTSFILLVSTLLVVIHRSFGSIEFIRSLDPTLSSEVASYYFFATCFLLFGIIPLSVVRFVLRDSPQDYGLRIGDAQFGFLMIALLVPLVSGGVLFPGSQLPEMRSWYPLAREAALSPGAFFQFELLRGLLFYTAWEFMFRSFILFSLRRHVGDWAAICIQTIPSCLWHLGMPLGETLLSIPGGVLFGYLALRTRSILWPFLLHWYIGIGLDLFIVLTN